MLLLANGLLKRMSSYAANITNSDAYWTKRRNELLATIEQRGLPTFFFTFSFANIHWPDLHRLMPGPQSTTRSQRYKNVLNNPHIVDWYYGHRLEVFIKMFFVELLQSKWYFYRHERQSRDAIHTHGVCRLENDPDIAILATVVYKGKLKVKLFPLTENNMNEFSSFINIIKLGSEAESRIVTYVDTLVTAMNNKEIPANPVVPDPHPCCIDIQLLDDELYDNDYIELVNCTQRHICRINGYCRSKKKNMENQCRYGFPFEKNNKTKIIFKENKNKNINTEVCLARNDPSMNQHSRLIAHAWRANVDLSMIINYSAAVNYMVKYATKSNF